MASLPGMGAVVLLLALVFYVFSVMATKLFAASFPDWFGSVAASAYSLFQIMTLESWSMGIVRPVMDVYPWAWVFFIPFIITTSFCRAQPFHRYHRLGHAGGNRGDRDGGARGDAPRAGTDPCGTQGAARRSEGIADRSCRLSSRPCGAVHHADHRRLRHG